ncbi:MAG: metalloregulator ArsR/SmtB family transcription factor [Acidobacteriota bacterium]
MSKAREQAARELAQAMDDRFLKALADQTRIRLIRHLLIAGPCCIGDIADKFPQDRSVISRHLRVLLDARLARASREGRRIVYDLDGPAFLQRLEDILQKARTLVAICCPCEPDQSPRVALTHSSKTKGRK